MGNSFEYMDIILLAMIADFIFLRLRGILGKKTGLEGEMSSSIKEQFQKPTINKEIKIQEFEANEQSFFLEGAKIAYETIITDFSDSDNKITKSKPLLSKKIYDQFKEALLERESKSQYAEITFIGINSATIKEHKKNSNSLEVIVDFESELITCVRGKDKKIISGDPEKIKKVYDTWKFSKSILSENQNWLLIETIN
jgi:predicted lipid-binding transport protein (Tim44 family)